jgi:peptidoglycan/xylan/chitin deacetylase (PgdA/CDA1 family)
LLGQGPVIAAIKRSSFALSKHLGLSGLVAESAWRRQRLLILCYHGVALDDEHRWNGDLFLSVAQFRQRMEILKNTGCTVLPLGEAVERLYAQTLPSRAVVLTFDDGYYDFLVRAWPVLQEYGYPATVYLTTARVEHNLPIVNLFISYMLWLARDRVLDTLGMPGLGGRYGLSTRQDRELAVTDIDRHNVAQQLDARGKDAVAKAVAERLALDYDALVASRVLTLMNPTEVAALAAAGVNVELHTHLHRTPEDPEVFVRDVLHNRRIIESITGTPARHLCYPSGVYRQSYLAALGRAGIVTATTCDPDMASRTADPLLLPRFVDTCGVSPLEFEAWVTGVASRLPRRTTKAHPSVH